MDALSPSRVARFSFKWKAFTCFLLIALADFFFYSNGPKYFGWTLGVWCGALLLAGTWHQGLLNTKHAKWVGLFNLGLVIAWIEKPNLLTFFLLFLGMLSLATLQKSGWIRSTGAWAAHIFVYFIFGWSRLFIDLFRSIRIRRKLERRGKRVNMTRVISFWIIPSLFSFIFIALIAAANPIIQSWLEALNLRDLFRFFSIRHLFFWIWILIMAWAILRPRPYVFAPTAVDAPPKLEHPVYSFFFNPSSITRALMLFNLLFLVQTLLDIIYLWNGAELPQGFSHAEYAHRGAYPLIATALLAALFVLLAMRPNSDSQKSSAIRKLVFLWIAQNVFLVISSIWRTYLYISEYSLTYLRVAALIWMGLVAAGLICIVARVAWRKSNKWLVNVNALLLLATLYICCFVDFSTMIAWYNVRHCQEITGQNEQPLDLGYLKKLGPTSLPALRWYNSQVFNPTNTARTVSTPDSEIKVTITHQHENKHTDVESVIETLEDQLRDSLQEWRGWTWRNWRLAQHLDLIEVEEDAR